MEELARTPYWLVTLDRARSLIRATRTSVPFADNRELAGALEQMKTFAARIDKSKHVLLLDLRNGPFRNDEGFEQVQGRYRVELFSGWAGMATLVGTAVGKLQVTRLAREERRQHHAFDDEGEALAFLASRLT